VKTIKLLSLELDRFKCYRNVQKLDLEGGLRFLTGENHVDDLGSNGAGKSSLWDAVCWCLYGKTFDGMKAGNVVSWGEKQCIVLMYLLVDDRRRSVKRVQNPNGLYLDGEPVDQYKINQLLGFDIHCFTQSVLFGQSGKLFFDMSPADRLYLFSDIMGLEIWSRCGVQAAVKTRDLERAVRQLELEVVKALNDRDHTNELLKQMLQKVGNWKYVQEDKVQEAIVGHKLISDKLVIQGTKVDSTNQEFNYTKTEISVLKKQAQELEPVVRERQGGLIEATSRCDKSEVLLDQAELRLDRFNKVGPICPVCMTEVNDKHRAVVRQNIEWEVRNLAARMHEYTRLRNEQVDLLDEAKAPLYKLDDRINEKESSLRSLETLCREARAQMYSLTVSMESMEKQIESLKKETNPFKQITDETSIKCRKYEELAKHVDAEHNKAIITLEATEACKGFFKELRLWLVSLALDELKLLTDSALADLGLGDWSAKYIVERETASQTMARGLVIEIRTGASEALLDSRVWSGGEAQRLRLAVQMALASLIQRRCGVDWKTEVWDEPTAHLTAEGVDDLINLLAHRAQDGKTVWLTDHRSVDSGLFDGVVKVEKTIEGTRICHDNM